MGSVLLSLLLSADPTVAVVLARRTSVSQAEAVALTESTSQALLNQAVPGVLPLAEVNRRLAKVAMSDATMCAGKPACIVELGRQLEVTWLVLVSVSQVAGEQSLAIELVNGSTGKVADNESLLLVQNGQVPMELLKPFAVRIIPRLRGEAADAPKVTTLVPTPVEPTLPEVPRAPEKSRVPSLVLGGAGVAALGIGVALLVTGLGGRARLAAGEPGPDGTTLSPLSGSEALTLNGATSLQFALSGASAAVGLGLGAAAVGLW